MRTQFIAHRSWTDPTRIVKMRPSRRRGRVVECTGLENQQSRKVLVGSNPTASATICRKYLEQKEEFFGLFPYPSFYPPNSLGSPSRKSSGPPAADLGVVPKRRIRDVVSPPCRLSSPPLQERRTRRSTRMPLETALTVLANNSTIGRSSMRARVMPATQSGSPNANGLWLNARQ